jgi:hypothetical protein
VRYVVIGMLAATIHGAPLFTVDADICPAADAENLDRLARALTELQARLREDDSLGLVNGGPIAAPFDCTARRLAESDLFELLTRAGEMDVVFKPAGSQGFADIDARATSVVIGGVSVRVASLDDVIRSKEAANRSKDQRALPLLRQLAEELRKRR